MVFDIGMFFYQGLSSSVIYFATSTLHQLVQEREHVFSEKHHEHV